MLILTILVIAI